MKIPAPFWCYFLPMVASSLGWIPRSHPAWDFLSRQLLPVCLVLLLIGTDLPALRRLGPKATLLMLAGAFGTALGGLVSFTLFRAWLPAGAWGGVAALTGSWIGGSANLLAVKEALAVPEALIGPIILVDAAIAYSWMALLIAGAAWQAHWERLASTTPVMVSLSNHDRSSLDKLGTNGWRVNLCAILVAVASSLLAQAAAHRLPPLGPGFTSATWTILLVTTAALVLSATPVRRIGTAGASRLGTLALYVLLVSIGARGNLQALFDAPAFFALGLVWIAIHGLCLLAAGYLLKAPLGLIATASQANIGGPISAPIVGATFSPLLAEAGLLMAILGNLLGTYAGLCAGLLARRLAPM